MSNVQATACFDVVYGLLQMSRWASSSSLTWHCGKAAMLLYGICSTQDVGEHLIFVATTPGCSSPGWISCPLPVVDGPAEQEAVGVYLVDESPFCQEGEVAARQEAVAGILLQGDLEGFALIRFLLQVTGVLHPHSLFQWSFQSGPHSGRRCGGEVMMT